jgi:molybdopterin/thiamine biosynthesis adenylyltransferase
MEAQRKTTLAGKGANSLKSENESLDFDRIKYLLNPEEFANIRVTVVGLGSGGAPVCDHLTMNGIRLWELYDPDVLDAVNLIKHPRLRGDLGRPKVDIQKEWIKDRNPSAEVETFIEDVMTSDNFVKSVRRSNLVLSCPDKKSVREFISDQCVAATVPFVTASVFRTGMGGEIFGYVPRQTGCYKCLQLYSLSNNINLSDDDLGLTPEEQDKIYGLGDRDFHASGLSIDIQMISLIQARMALSILLRNSEGAMPRLKSNWIIFGNRPAKGIFSRHFEVKQLLLKPQNMCNCTSEENSTGDLDAE